MAIQVIRVSGNQSEAANFISWTLIRLDMGDCGAIEDGTKIIAAINKAMKRKDLPKGRKKDMKRLRETLQEMIRRLAT